MGKSWPPTRVPPMTFNDLCRQLRVTPSERVDLAHHLAVFRYRRTIEQLLGIEGVLSALRETPNAHR